MTQLKIRPAVLPLVGTTLLLAMFGLGLRVGSATELWLAYPIGGPLDGDGSGLAPADNSSPATTPAISSGSFNIQIVPGATLAANSAALAAFDRAAALWEAKITTPITVTINADLGSFGNPNIIGSTSSVILQGGYDTIRNQMVAEATGKPAKSIVTHLPTSSQFHAILPGGITLNGNMELTKANAKALGFTGLDSGFGVSDATITFNQAFSFDYDNSNGVDPGKTDFETVATHELGHALGFISDVDDVDFGGTSVAPTTLDLFRFQNATANDPTTVSQFTTFSRDMTPGTADNTSDLVNKYAMSTGVNSGDGRQASHWKDDQLTAHLIGVMDPTLAAGVVEVPTAADFRAMQLIGYELVPEPTTWLLAVVGIAILGWRRRAMRFGL